MGWSQIDRWGSQASGPVALRWQPTGGAAEAAVPGGGERRARAIWVVEDAPGEVLALGSTPIRLLPFCSFPLPICAHPLVSQRIIIIKKKLANGSRKKNREHVGSSILGSYGVGHTWPPWPSWLPAPVPEAVIQLDRPGLCILLRGGYRGASCTLQVARKTFSFSFHLCQCCLQTPKGIFRKLVIQAMESEHE